ncbi:hypothetical protein [Streptomyces natalensis]|uniref:Uncharacterized protein n=1 Tax=Streptomyces natalensis ATCC 27448 TaxID=1240678 RepID=A0A0D7CAJ3_9ACTN|nr:hypothetical protein [Streptomyces natalensis]KIZ13284.1 hypothetical protein SNA_38140 [Streptomyces natalensis ATCC 27448]
MGKALRVVAGTLGAGALLASAAGAAGAEGRVHQNAECAPAFSLLLPPSGSCTILIDNHKNLALLKQAASGDISGDASLVGPRGLR